MPESVRDRPTRNHETVFLLAKNERYFYDAEAIAEPVATDTEARYLRGRSNAHKYADGGLGNQTIAKSLDHLAKKRRKSGNLQRDIPTPDDGRGILNPNLGRGIPWEDDGTGRNARTVWDIQTEAYKDAHFAVFARELARRCIVAGSSAKGRCPKCNAPWRRVTSVEYRNPGNRTTNGPRSMERKHIEFGTAGFEQRLERHTQTVGWEPTCDHDEAPIPEVVLDPFGGSGTVASVAIGNGRSSVYIDLKPEYLEMARRRIGPMFVVDAPALAPNENTDVVPFYIIPGTLQCSYCQAAYDHKAGTHGPFCIYAKRDGSS
jgi:hypothetical protein